MLRAKDVAELLHVDTSTVLEWEKTGVLDGHVSVKGRHCYDEKVVDALVRESTKITLEEGDELIKSGEARRILNVVQSTLWKLSEEGTIPVAFVTPTGRRLYRRKDIEDYHEKMYGKRIEPMEG